MSISPAAMGNLFLAAQGTSALGAGAQGYVQGRAQRLQGNYEHQVAKDNAALLDLRAKDVERQGERAAAMKGLETKQLLSAQRAAAGGSGVDVASGSVQALAGETAEFGALEREAVTNDTWRKAWGLRAEATGMRRAGRNARDAGRFNARMSAVSGGLQAGRDLLQGAYGYQQFRRQEPPKDHSDKYEKRDDGLTDDEWISSFGGDFKKTRKR